MRKDKMNIDQKKIVNSLRQCNGEALGKSLFNFVLMAGG